MTDIQNVLISKENFITFNLGRFKDFYDVGHVLGKGNFGEVRACLHHVSKDVRAVKSISKQRMGNECFKNFKTEIESLKKLDHPNILKLYEVF